MKIAILTATSVMVTVREIVRLRCTGLTCRMSVGLHSVGHALRMRLSLECSGRCRSDELGRLVNNHIVGSLLCRPLNEK